MPGKPHEVKVPGTISLGELADQIRAKFKIPVWDTIIIKRADDKPFCAEDRGTYALQTVCDEEADTRLKITVRFDALDRTFFSGEIKFDQTKDFERADAATRQGVRIRDAQTYTMHVPEWTMAEWTGSKDHHEGSQII
jgi:hypothetical protein